VLHGWQSTGTGALRVLGLAAGTSCRAQIDAGGSADTGET